MKFKVFGQFHPSIAVMTNYHWLEYSGAEIVMETKSMLIF